MSLIDASINPIYDEFDNAVYASYPCLSAMHASKKPDTLHTGSLPASDGTRVLSLDSTRLSKTVVFAVCYSDSGGSIMSKWDDSGIRVSVSKIESILYGVEAGRNIRISTSKHLANDCFPQVANAKITYSGDSLPVYKWLSLVDASLNEHDPCVFGAIAAAGVDSTHSGAARAGNGVKEVTMPQSVLLSKLPVAYAVCYAETNGLTSDTTWRDSYVRFKITKVESIAVNSKHLSSTFSFKTSRNLPNIQDLQLTYSGSLIGGKYLSVVDQMINTNNPCGLGSVAAATSNDNYNVLITQTATQSGSLTAFASTSLMHGKTLTLKSSALDTSKTYAVCYTDEGGDTASIWQDAGIRFTVSKISSLLYGLPNVRTITPATLATHVIPESGEALYTYVGDLPNAKWIAVVDATLNTNNPCGVGTIVAAGADSIHSGVIQAGVSDKVVNLLMHHRLGTYDLSHVGVALDASKTFAVCYAENSGETIDTTWDDSFIRLKVSKVQTIQTAVHSIMTFGQLGNGASVTLTYMGTMIASKYISLVDSALHLSNPCTTGVTAAASVDGYHSGVAQANADNIVTINTTPLSTTITFAVCYTEGAGNAAATWVDSGVRLTISKVTQLSYGESAREPARSMTYQNTATNRLPQVASMILTYQ